MLTKNYYGNNIVLKEVWDIKKIINTKKAPSAIGGIGDGNYPARPAVEVARLPKDALVEAITLQN